MKLFEQFSQRGYHSCVMTSFAIDFAAFENVLLNRLRSVGCNNNLVIADAGMLAYAMASTSEFPLHAGRRYTVTGAKAEGVFHPKLILQLGVKVGRLFVSSANLTAPGLGGNKEVIGQVAASSGMIGESQLLASAWRYAQSFLDLEQEAIANQVARIRKQTAWLMDIQPADGLVSLSNGDAAAFLDSQSKQTTSTRFSRYIAGDNVKKLIVISPYWDEDLRTLRTLQKAIGADEVCVLVGGPAPSFPAQALKDSDSIRLYSLTGEQSRFVHGKVYIAQTKQADHVLYGSANCTTAGLGGARLFPWRNEEACLYRRMKVGAALSELGLTASLVKGRALGGSDLPRWHVRPDVPRNAAMARNPGRFEIKGTHLLWWPSTAYSHPDSRLDLLDQNGTALPVELNKHTAWVDAARRYTMPPLTEMPYFARARVGDNTSVASIIVLADVLRQETREPRSRRFDEESSRLRGNERIGPWILEFIDLIAQAETAELESEPDQIKAGKKKPAARLRAPTLSSRTLSYEEFTANRKSGPDHKTEFHQAFAGSDFDLVRRYLNRLIGLEAGPVEHAQLDDAADVRAALELQDEAQVDQDDDYSPTQVQLYAGDFSEDRRQQLEKDKIRGAFAARLAARDEIVAFSAKFCDQMRQKAKKSPLVLQDMFRLRAVLLMMLGAAYPIGSDRLKGHGTEWQVLPADGEQSWALLIGRLLSTFFNKEGDLIGELRVVRGADGPAVELVEGVVTCIWAILACRIAVEARGGMHGMDVRLSELSDRIYERSGLTQVELQEGTVATVLRKMTSTFPLGFSLEEMLSLHQAATEKLQLKLENQKPSP
ncbi:hypothetical protein XSP_003832 [Xanthomonas euroxanthea]|uniref:Phospholipase D-like domain-containing protein n=1 Tax=Xanthomonas euroxanthea TaxID=2259622 RepID=A0A8E4E8R5_9XANT|nr:MULTISPECIES: hypothetical protein [Xanthomonas]CAD1796960.1 hypothetical protein XSP_003832 [Xanthomonas euroxanthea]SYZ54831.1 hypothetical protein CPBF367_23160 [Xanthomonas arboricola pv. juglandis]